MSIRTGMQFLLHVCYWLLQMFPDSRLSGLYAQQKPARRGDLPSVATKAPAAAAREGSEGSHQDHLAISAGGDGIQPAPRADQQLPRLRLSWNGALCHQ